MHSSGNHTHNVITDTTRRILLNSETTIAPVQSEAPEMYSSICVSSAYTIRRLSLKSLWKTTYSRSSPLKQLQFIHQ